MKMRIVLFGSSANPPTGLLGHMGIIQYFSRIFEEVWILPVFHHPYFAKRQLETFEKRIEMLHLSLRDCGLNDTNIFIKEYERDCLLSMYPDYENTKNQIRFGTIDIILWLKQQFPDSQFSMIIGEDSFIDLKQNKWRESELLRNTLHFEVLCRKGINSDIIYQSEPWFTLHSIDTLDNVSSTQARTTSDSTLLKNITTPSVADYISVNHLYSFQSLVYLNKHTLNIIYHCKRRWSFLQQCFLQIFRKSFIIWIQNIITIDIVFNIFQWW